MRYGFLVLLIACTGEAPKDTDIPLEGPELVHTELAAVLEGTASVFEVTATDPEGVGSVTLYHRVEGETTWVQAPMIEGEGGVWSTTLETTDVDDPGVEYYFKGIDDGDVPATSYLPAEAASAPYTLRVAVVGTPLPYVQGFEYDETTSTLSELGWANASLGFNGYGWDTSATEAYAGTQSVFHSRGYTGIPEMEDWLVSPALDFSAAPNAQVTWREYGRQTSTANHALYVSVGSRDPDDGEYVAVSEALPAPSEAAWGRSAVYDLSAYAGSPTVYLAWRFVGESADDWYVDDVRVEELQPDLVLDTAAAAAPLDPGASTTLTVSVENLGLVDASDLTVTVAFPEGGASVAETSVAIASVSAGGTGEADFALTVDAATPDNRYVPLSVTVTDGDSSWTLDDPLLVGEASVATVEYTPSATGSVELILGAGDPDAPSWETTLYDANATDPLSFAVDITDQGELLPPAAGPMRWFVRATGEVAGTLDAFTIRYDGVDYVASVLPSVAAEETVEAYVPEPPSFTARTTTVPTELAPGDSGVTLSLVVTNVGDATQGGVTATLASSDPDITITDAGPVALTGAALGAGSSATLTGAFSLDISAAHTDSTDLAVELLLDDGVESWSVPLSLAVPFPYLAATNVDIDDDGRDGELNADESADLTFTVENLGDQSTEGALTATLTAESSSSASVSISTNVEGLRELTAGRTDTNDDPWTVTVSGGADGDTVDLLLTLVDSVRAYEVRTTLILGEPTWEELDPRGDPIGDALDGWDFDIIGGRYRVNDGVLQVQLDSATVYDPGALFIEAWGYSTVSDWSLYRLVAQSGRGTLEGYNSGFTLISEPVISYPSDTQVQIDIVVEDMGLSVDAVSFGFASGWCGPDEYYCDHFPDDWGYPYDTWNSALFFDLAW